MRREWVAAALLAGMIGLACWHVNALGELTGELGGLLIRAGELAAEGDWDGAAGLTRAAEERWDGNHLYLHATLEHDVTDQIATGFAETLEFIRSREPAVYAAANARLIRQLELLGEMERPMLENLL